jgi:hypothetical protein
MQCAATTLIWMRMGVRPSSVDTAQAKKRFGCGCESVAQTCYSVDGGTADRLIATRALMGDGGALIVLLLLLLPIREAAAEGDDPLTADAGNREHVDGNVDARAG